MIAKFFIDRPVFGVVISVVIALFGIAAYTVLPVAQYPEIAPPTVQVSCIYPGADARVVQDTVAAPIEQQVNGVEKMLYMSSQSSNDGSYNLTVTFELGTNLDMAQVLVQNRVSMALASLPDVVQATGVTTKKRSPSILLVVNLYSDTNPETKEPFFNQLYLSNYATIQIKDELARVNGVGDVSLLGQQDYSMRVWLDPERLASRNLTALDVVSSLREQNVQVAAGQLGQPPVPRGQDFQYTLTTLGRLVDAEQFDEIVIKTGKSGQVSRLKDVARTELGPKSMTTLSTLDGKPSIGLAIFQLPGSNALVTADNIREKMTELKTRFPVGLEYSIVYDTTPFIDESIHEVINTLTDAIVLVAIVVLFFLQDWKAMILPMIDVPVSLLGTFAVMYMVGFTLNNLTLFGLVLAIGIVVDDAIVVLEAVESWIARGLKPREATIKAMDEITGPIVAITLVLSSVFLPSAILVGGISGQFYRQFALTIAASMAISAINALTMTPSRAVSVFGSGDDHHGEHKREALPWWGLAFIVGWVSYRIGLKFFGQQLGLVAEHEGGHAAHSAATDWQSWAWKLALFAPGAVVGAFAIKPVNAFLAVIFAGFNKLFDWTTRVYGAIVARSLRFSLLVLAVYGGLLVLTGYQFAKTPVGFIPSQDKGYLICDVQLPDAASLERTSEVMAKATEIALGTKGVIHAIAIPGQSFVQNTFSSNFASMFIIFDEFHNRHATELYGDAIANSIRQQFFAKIPEARLAVYGPPAVDGLGNAGGFKLMLEDRGDQGLETLQGQADNLAEKATQLPGFVAVFNGFRASVPQMYVDVDRTKCKTLQVPLSEVFNTLQACLGSYYVNDINRFGRTWQVNVQADAQFRLQPADVGQLKVRNTLGDMVPIGTVAEVLDSSGPVAITRYNQYPAASVMGITTPVVSAGQALKAMDDLCKTELPSNMVQEWTELSLMQRKEGNGVFYAFGGALILVYLILAAMYESYSMPFSVILVVPMCLLCAVTSISIVHMDLNIFVQVGLIVLVGLAAKNAILIVEFAKTKHAEGTPLIEATVEASKMRLRPIIMTSFAFILGVVPLVVSKGAGAEMRRTLGTAVFGGMLGVTFFGIFLTPVFFYVIQKWLGKETKSLSPG